MIYSLGLWDATLLHAHLQWIGFCQMNRRAVFTRAPDTLPAVKREALAVNNQVIYLPRQLQSGSVFVTLFQPVLCICISLQTDLGFQSEPFKEN